MGERKVLNYYVPPDIDPSKVPRIKKDLTKPIEVRTMIPFSMRCSTCSEYMYQGKKFNCKMEVLQNETYLGIRIRRFYIKCTNCSAAITYKTDPKNSGYEMEGGASRNFEAWKETEDAVADAKATRKEEDDMDAMKKLENRTLDNKREMDVLDALEAVRALNQRHERVDTKALISTLFQQQQNEGQGVAQELVLGPDGLTDAERDMLASVNFKSKARVGVTANGVLIRTLADSDSDQEKDPVAVPTAEDGFSVFDRQTKPKPKPDAKLSDPLVTIIKKKRKIDHVDAPQNLAAIADPVVQAESGGVVASSSAVSAAVLGLSGYGSDSD
jgi:hypothetical protein